jgi:uncharacterized protein DUF4384
MRRSMWLASIAVLSVPYGAALAQTQRWNDRAQAQPLDDAPRVTVEIEGSRVLDFGQPVRVHFRVSDDAYVVVAHVTSDGRLTIIFPESQTGRTFVRGNVDMLARGRYSGSFASFYARENSGTGYVFAIASYAPVDLSRFKYADFERSGFATPFQNASRSVAFRPEAMMERFARWVLYDENTEFDYDVDFYSVSTPVYASALAACSASGYMFGEWDVLGQFGYNPYRALCGGYYNAYLSCLGFSIYNYYGGCAGAMRPFIVSGQPTTPPTTPSTPTESPINTKVIVNGIPHPTPIGPIDDGGNGKPTDQPSRVGKLAPSRDHGEGWDHLYAIPNRSLDNLKRSTMDEMRRKDGSAGSRFRGWAETEARGADPRAGGANAGQTPAQTRTGVTRGTDAPAREPAGYQTRRTGGGDDNSRSSGAAPARETPRTYAPAGETPRSSAPPRGENPRSEAPARASAPAHEAPAASPKASSGSGSQTTKSTSGSSTEPKKPPM